MLKEDYVADLAKTLLSIDFNLAELQRIKEELSSRLAAVLEHREEGQTSYTEGRYKIVCKSGIILSLDKEEYEVTKSQWTMGLNPVRMKQTYDIDRDMLRKIEVYGSDDDKLLVERLISSKPSKLNVKVSASA